MLLKSAPSRDAARDYAISVSAAFNAHIAAIGFAYAPVLPPMDTVSALPFDILDAEREAEPTGRVGCHCPVRGSGTACRRVGRVAPGRGLVLRRHQCFRIDRPLVRPVRRRPGRSQIHARRSDDRRRPVRFRKARPGRSLYPADRPQARPRHGLLGRQPQCRARDQRRHAVSHARQDRRCGHDRRGQGQRPAKSKASISHNTSRGTD